eukprot:scaffold110160_cov30-Prasinocladus_malaysianus.AAC.1
MAARESCLCKAFALPATTTSPPHDNSSPSQDQTEPSPPTPPLTDLMNAVMAHQTADDDVSGV